MVSANATVIDANAKNSMRSARDAAIVRSHALRANTSFSAGERTRSNAYATPAIGTAYRCARRSADARRRLPVTPTMPIAPITSNALGSCCDDEAAQPLFFLAGGATGAGFTGAGVGVTGVGAGSAALTGASIGAVGSGSGVVVVIGTQYIRDTCSPWHVPLLP